MIYSTEPAPKTPISPVNCQYDRLYSLTDGGDEYVVYRVFWPGIGNAEQHFVDRVAGLSWHFDGVDDPNAVLYDDIPDGFKLVFEQGTVV